MCVMLKRYYNNRIGFGEGKGVSGKNPGRWFSCFKYLPSPIFLASTQEKNGSGRTAPLLFLYPPPPLHDGCYLTPGVAS